MKRLIVSASTIVVLAGGFASGQSPTVRIAFDDGKVTLAASNALVTDVLAAWAEVGGTEITGVENVQAAARVTVDFKAASELTALDELLGTTGGYITGLRSEVPPGTSLLRVIQIGLRSKGSKPVKAAPVIDMSIPESRFEYANPAPDFPDPPLNDELPPPGPYIIPELRFQYAETPMPPPSEPDVQPEVQPEEKPADPNTASKKKPPQDR
jgi:hypothetical protein